MKKTGLFLITIFFLASFLSLTSADMMNGDYGDCPMAGMMRGVTGYGFGISFFGFLWNVLLVIILILVIIWLFQQIQKNNRKK